MSVSAVAVIIVNAGVYDDLENCLNSVLSGTRLAHEVVVVDNVVEQRRLAMLEAKFGAKVRWIPMERNVGFGVANNIGVAKSSASLLLLLNPDTIVPMGAIDRLVAIFEENPKLGVLAPTLLNRDGTTQASAYALDPSVRAMCLDAFGLQFLYRALALHTNSARARNISSRNTAWLKGACLLLRRRVWDQLSGFDQSFYMFGEDADLCRRAREGGLQVAVTDRVRITHIGGTSYANSGMGERAVRDYYSGYELLALRQGSGRFVRSRRRLLRVAMWTAAFSRSVYLGATSPAHPGRRAAARAYWKYVRSPCQPNSPGLRA